MLLTGQSEFLCNYYLDSHCATLEYCHWFHILNSAVCHLLMFCRVFGTTVDEDDDIDDSESENPDVLDEENVTDSFSDDNPTNLFASATGNASLCSH